MDGNALAAAASLPLSAAVAVAASPLAL